MEEQNTTFDWSSLEKLIPLCIELIVQYKNKDKKKINVHETAQQIGAAFGIDDINEFAKERIGNTISDKLELIVGKEGSGAIAAIFAVACGPIMTTVYTYAKGDSSSSLFTSCLDTINTDLTNDLAQSIINDFQLSEETANAIAEDLGPYAVSIACFTAAFKIYRTAADDARIATERRIEAERLSQEAISKLLESRHEMENVLEKSLLGKLIPFEKCISGIDQALLENNDDKFIAANIELWKVFGKEKQYNNAGEFDALMLSNEAFKL